MAYAHLQHSQARAPEPSGVVGLAAIARIMFRNIDVTPLRQALLHRIGKNPSDAGALHDLATIELLSGNRESGLALQALALQRNLQPTVTTTLERAGIPTDAESLQLRRAV